MNRWEQWLYRASRIFSLIVNCFSQSILGLIWEVWHWLIPMKQTVLLTLLFTDPIFDIFILPPSQGNTKVWAVWLTQVLLKTCRVRSYVLWTSPPPTNVLIQSRLAALLHSPALFLSSDEASRHQILWAGCGLAWNSIKFLLFSDQEVRSPVFPGQDNYHRPSLLLSQWYDRVNVSVSSKCRTWLNGITSCVYPPELLTMTPIFCPVRGTGLYIPLYVSSWPTIESDIS